MKTLHLFAGGGGGLFADLILGHRPAVAIENDEDCCNVLRSLRAAGWFPELEIIQADVRDVDYSKWEGCVDQISAGFPCQDISSAGKGAGIRGTRSGLFSEVIRAAESIGPKFLFLENSPFIRTRGRDVVLRSVVEAGYSCRDGTLAASHVGAGHRRNRWWCLAANPDGIREPEPQRGFQKQRRRISDIVEAVAVADSIRCYKGARVGKDRHRSGRRISEHWSAFLNKQGDKTIALALQFCELCH